MKTCQEKLVAALRKPDRLLCVGERKALCSKLWTTSKVFISQENDLENRRSRKRVCEIKE
jgi:hypothetical protein